MREIKNETQQLQIKSPVSKKMQNSDEKYLTVLETADSAGEEVVNI